MKIPGSLSQRDSRWAKTTLGFNPPTARDDWGQPYNIGHYGCLVTAVSNLLWYTGKPGVTPQMVNDWLKNNKGFEPGGGLMKWDAVPRSHSDLRDHGMTRDLAAVNRYLAGEGSFAIVQLTKPGFPMHFAVMPYVDAIVDSWDGLLKPVGSYTFVKAMLFGDVTPDFVTEPMPATAPKIQPANPNTSFIPLSQKVMVVAPTLDVRLGPGTNYPGHHANTPDKLIHGPVQVTVTGVAIGTTNTVAGGHTSNKWFRSINGNWFAAAGTAADENALQALFAGNQPEPPKAPVPPTVPIALKPEQLTPAPGSIVLPKSASTPPIPAGEGPLDSLSSDEKPEPMESPGRRMHTVKETLVYDLNSGAPVEKVAEGETIEIAKIREWNGQQYIQTPNMLKTAPTHGMALTDFITPPPTPVPNLSKGWKALLAFLSAIHFEGPFKK